MRVNELDGVLAKPVCSEEMDKFNKEDIFSVPNTYHDI